MHRDQHGGDPDPDKALVARYGAGDPMAARDLTARLAPPVHRLAARMLGDAAEAEDVAQEAMLRLWRRAADWPDDVPVRAWVLKVAANLCIDRLRARRNRPLDAAGDPPDPGPGAVAALLEGDRALALQAALMALPERQRQAVILRHLEGLANPEIAAIMDLGVEAVESLTARGRQGLKVLLSGRKADLGYEGS